jgi:hypothetical protein
MAQALTAMAWASGGRLTGLPHLLAVAFRRSTTNTAARLGPFCMLLVEAEVTAAT